MIPQEQVTGVLALQADAAGVPQVGHALTAEGVAVHTIPHQVEVLLLLAARPAPPTIQSGMGMAGGAFPIRGAMARLAGWMTGGAAMPAAEQPLGTRGEAPARQQHVGSRASRAVLGRIPCAACTGGVALSADSCAIHMELGLAVGEAKAMESSFPGQMRLQDVLGRPASQALRGPWAGAGAAGWVATLADVVMLVKTLSTVLQALALAQCQREGTGGAVSGQRSLTRGA